MTPRFVSLVAVLFCGAILAIAAVFGYSRYKAAEIANAQFQTQLKIGAQNPSTALGPHAPAIMPVRQGYSFGSPAP